MAEQKTKFFYGEEQDSPVGEANWIYINTRINVYQGQESYSITMKFDDKYTEKLKNQLEKLLDESMKSEEGKKLKWSRNPVPGYSEDAEGNITFKMSTKRRDENKELIKVPLFDSKGNMLDPNINLMPGSKVIAKFQPAVYHLNGQANGVTIYLEGLQLIEPKIFNSDKREVKFAPVDGGYVKGDTKYETDEITDEEIPF